MQNIELLEEKKMTVFRKLAISSWKKPVDPKIYTRIKCDLSSLDTYLSTINISPKISLIHVFSKIMAIVCKAHPEINTTIIRKKTYQRKHITGFIHTHLSTKNGYDLLGVSIENIDQLSLIEISKLIQTKTKELKQNKNKKINNAKRVIQNIPVILCEFAISLFDFAMYTLNINHNFIGLPGDQYGSFGITAVGSLGFEEAFVPLFPFSRCGIMLSVGKPFETYEYDGAKHVKKKYVYVCFTIDHRYFDGAHFSKPLRLFKKIINNPKKYLN